MVPKFPRFLISYTREEYIVNFYTRVTCVIYMSIIYMCVCAKKWEPWELFTQSQYFRGLDGSQKVPKIVKSSHFLKIFSFFFENFSKFYSSSYKIHTQFVAMLCIFFFWKSINMFNKTDIRFWYCSTKLA